MKAVIRGYQLFISPVLPGSCRYRPTCSEYAIEAITGHGMLKGGWLAFRRILRCNPWAGWGYDPVPPAGKPGCGDNNCGNSTQDTTDAAHGSGAI